MEQHLRAGIAVYNAGAYHAAHDAWEARWLDLEDGTDDERLLHGLIQYTAAVYHAINRNWAGAVGLAESGLSYLEAAPEDYRGVDVATAREYLDLLATDPERIGRAAPWPLVFDGEQVLPGHLSDAELAIAAETVAEDEGLDTDVVERAAARLVGEGEPPEADESRSLLVGLVERPDVVLRLQSFTAGPTTGHRGEYGGEPEYEDWMVWAARGVGVLALAAAAAILAQPHL